MTPRWLHIRGRGRNLNERFDVSKDNTKSCIRECVVCGAAFNPRGPQITCSEECRRVRTNERYRNKRVRFQADDRTCRVCGVSFSPRTSRQHTCGTQCASVWQSNLKKLIGERKKRTPELRVCVTCGETFETTRANMRNCSSTCSDTYKRRYNVRYTTESRRTDPRRRIDASMSEAIRQSIKSRKNGRTWNSIVGYSTDELLTHLESLFSDGMDWSNYGEWEIDHIVPKSWFTYSSYDDESFCRCWALGNLQPMWSSDNRSKGNRFSGAA
jgi:predicted nucleic acid-binding Zn ribbon protein